MVFATNSEYVDVRKGLKAENATNASRNGSISKMGYAAVSFKNLCN